MKAAWTAFILLATPLAGCVSDPGPDPGRVAEPGELGPFWAFTDTEGVTHSRNTSSGDPTVLFFMATWCSSCQRLTQELKQVHADYAERGVDFYSISWDPSDDDESLEAWKERFDQAWPHGVDPQFQIQRTFGVRSQSSVVVLDGDGRVTGAFGYGQANARNLPPVIDEAFERSATAQA